MTVFGFLKASVPSTRDWEIATVLRLAAKAFCKQYCLSDAERSRGRASCIARASLKTVAPIPRTRDCSLDFCSQCINFKGVRELAPSGHRFFGYFLFIKKKKVTLS